MEARSAKPHAADPLCEKESPRNAGVLRRRSVIVKLTRDSRLGFQSAAIEVVLQLGPEAGVRRGEFLSMSSPLQ